jgi:capsid protein
MSHKFAILDGRPVLAMNGHKRPRTELAEAIGLQSVRRSARLSFDAARSGGDLEAHFQFADSLDPDSSHVKGVRDTLIKRSRYEQGSNGFYDGSLTKHVNRIFGATGPQLRMLTGNRAFNQLIEREWFRWTQQVQFRRKLWAMGRARYGDGETLAIIQTNPALPGVQLDFLPIEAEQCQSPYPPITEQGVIDGVIFDELNNIVAYDILPQHPGGTFLRMSYDAVRIPASSVVHWFKLRRPGAHRGIPDSTPSLGVGAMSRRHREATAAAIETAADIAAIIYSRLNPNSDDERYPLLPMTETAMPKRAIVSAPEGWEVSQMKGEHPNAQYSEFHRLQLSEQGAPLVQPLNVTAGDSSNYSFASGKLDTIFYREAIDVERADCSDLVLDPLFAEWFREWRSLPADDSPQRRALTPAHQWDWPAHPVIDAVAEASAKNTQLLNGSTTLRQVYSDQGMDYEDQLAIQAEDAFGEVSDETIAKMRQINVLRNTPQAAIQHVAQLLGLQPVSGEVSQPDEPTGQIVQQLALRVAQLEAHQR